MTFISRWSVPLLTAAVACLPLGVRSQSLTNIAGVWNGIVVDVPAQMTTVISLQGLVTDVPQSSDFGANNFSVTVLANGTFTGDGTGTATVSGQGIVTIDPDDGQPISFRVNRAQDVFIGLANDNDSGHEENGLNLVVRAPASVSTNDLAGVWSLKSFATPRELIKIFAPTTNGSALTDLLGFDSSSVAFSQFSKIQSGSMTINSDGTFSGALENSFTGTYVIEGAKIHLSINTGEGTLLLTNNINASRDTMFALNKEDGNRQEIIMMTKSPTNITLADLQGVWKVTSFNVPEHIDLTHNASNFVTAVTPSSDFDMSQNSFTAGHDGFVTAVLEDGPAIGRFSIGTGGAITITLTNSTGDFKSHTGQLNDGKNCFTLVEGDSSRSETSIVVKAPDFPGGTGRELGLLYYQGIVYWASDTNRLLQATGDLGSSWTNISATEAQHSFEPSYTNSTEFFRVQDH